VEKKHKRRRSIKGRLAEKKISKNPTAGTDRKKEPHSTTTGEEISEKVRGGKKESPIEEIL